MDTSNVAKSLVMDISQSGFEFWQDSEFRKLVSFDSLSQTEQDRIFNEVLVTGLGLLVLYLDSAVAEIALTKHQVYFDKLQKLIDMRLEENREDYQLALGESSNWKEFNGDLKMRKTWAQIETVTIDGLSHIRRGKVKKDDPLWKMLRFWLLGLSLEEVKLKKTIHSGKC